MTNTAKPTKRESSKIKKEQYWRDQIDAYRASGKSAKQWSDENKINVHTLVSWITKLGLQHNASKHNKNKIEHVQSEPKITNKPETKPQQPHAESLAPQPQTQPKTQTQLPQHKSQTQPEPTTTLDLTSPTEEVVKIKHGAITITAEAGYDKETLLSLIQTLLSTKS